MRRNILGAALAALTISAAPAAFAQSAPLDSPLTIVVGYVPGGSSDRIARLVANRLKDRVGVPVIVDNRTGAGGRIAAQGLRAVKDDRNVLMIGNPAVMVVAPLVYAEPGYDAKADFTPVSLVSRYKFALAVPASSPIHDVQGLRQWLRENPNKFTVGVPAMGSLPHFFALMLGQELRETPEVIGYRGSAPLIVELVSSVLSQAVDTLDTLLPQHQAGKIRILAVSGEARDANVPDVPTFRELGVNLVADGWNAFFAPASMSADKVARLGRDIAEIMREPAVQKVVRDVYLEPVSADAQATATSLTAYRQQWEPMVKNSGFTMAQ